MSRTAYRELVPLWAELSLRWPLIRPLLVALVGCWRTFYGIAKWDRFKCLEMISLATGAGPLRSFLIYLRSETSVAWSNVEFAALEARSADELAEWVVTHCRVESVENAQVTAATGSPIIVLVTSFAPHYFGLLTSTIAELATGSLTIVQPSMAVAPLEALRFYEKISEVIGCKINTILAENPFALVQSSKALKSHSVVAMRVDSLPVRTNNFLICSLFGKPSVFPASILQLAAREGAILLPMFVLRRNRGFVSRFGTPVRLGSAPDHRQLSVAVEAINRQLEATVGEFPASYSSWYGMYEKMRLADEIMQEANRLPTGDGDLSSKSRN